MIFTNINYDLYSNKKTDKFCIGFEVFRADPILYTIQLIVSFGKKLGQEPQGQENIKWLETVGETK